MVIDRVRGTFRTIRNGGRAILDSGLLHPIRPDRAARLVFPLVRYGTSPGAVGGIAALRFPGRTALIDETGTLTYAELERRTAALATALRARLPEPPEGRDASEEPGPRLGILCRNHRGFVEALLAGSRTGHDLVLLNTDFSAPQLGAVMERERVGAVVADQEFAPLLDLAGFDGLRIVAWSDGAVASNCPTASDGRVAEETIDELVAGTEPEPLVTDRTSEIVILTSGTTGTPKGARHELSPSALLPAALTHALRVPLRSGDPILIGPPVFHTLGLTYLLAGLGLGMQIILTRRFDPAETRRLLDRHQAGALVAVPIMLQRLLDAPATGHPSTLRTVVCAGAALHPALSEAFMDEFGDILVNVYGATETGWATIATPADLRAAPGTVGKPSLGLTVRIFTPEGEAPPGVTGEIFVGGGLHFAGYTGGGGKEIRDGLTATGDLGHFDDEGRLFVDGRADDMIVSGGENVFPGEVEALLAEHPAVREVAVVGVPDQTFGQRLAAHVIAGEEVAEDDLKDYVRRRLARYKVPREIHFVAELPRTPTGKVKSRRLTD